MLLNLELASCKLVSFKFVGASMPDSNFYILNKSVSRDFHECSRDISEFYFSRSKY